MSPFANAMESELNNAREKWGPQKSAHESYAVILEELDEFWDEVKKKKSERSKEKMLAELIQVAAMCQRAAEDLRLIPSESATPSNLSSATTHGDDQ